MNFSGATTGSFTQLVLAGAVTDSGSNGLVSGGNIPIRVLASDSAATIAARIAQAVNGSGIPGLSASATGDTVQFVGVEILDDGPLQSVGIAPGGIIRGATMINSRMYAVSDEGGLYFVDSPTFFRTGNVGTYVTTSYELTGIRFTALSKGPQITSPNGQLSQILFGLDEGGNIHAFDTEGRLVPVFANGATSISTGLTSLNGLAFSTLNRNLWHVTGNRGNDPGHGFQATPNNSRINVTGGSSFYFGFESPGNPNHLTYNFPGGASGAMESQTFSLETVTTGDQPTLYFNYFLDTEQSASELPLADTAQDYMRDSMRVYVSGEDGQWILAATNNDPAGVGVERFDEELENGITGLSDRLAVQRLFDNTGGWRQARVPLTNFAGQKNVKVRIEFSSAGGFGYGLQGGKGPEIRTIEGERLVDGETLLINGQVFEIEMGPTLALPSGNGISNGDFVIVEGTRYVFSDGAPVVSPDVAVNYSKTMTSDQVASVLQQAIIANPPGASTISGLNFINEANDTIDSAEASGTIGQSVRVVGNGEIGDNPSLSEAGQDVDLIRIDVERGATITAEVQAAILGSSLDSML
jgi:hypothetical protein